MSDRIRNKMGLVPVRDEGAQKEVVRGSVEVRETEV
jgi:hypothetical protein